MVLCFIWLKNVSFLQLLARGRSCHPKYFNYVYFRHMEERHKASMLTGRKKKIALHWNPAIRYLSNTVTSLLRPLFLPPCKMAIQFLVKKKPRHWNGQPLIRPNFCGPLMVVLTGFHGNWLNNHSLKEHEVSMERYNSLNGLFCFLSLLPQWIFQDFWRQWGSEILPKRLLVLCWWIISRGSVLRLTQRNSKFQLASLGK